MLVSDVYSSIIFFDSHRVFWQMQRILIFTITDNDIIIKSVFIQAVLYEISCVCIWFYRDKVICVSGFNEHLSQVWLFIMTFYVKQH